MRLTLKEIQEQIQKIIDVTTAQPELNYLLSAKASMVIAESYIRVHDPNRIQHSEDQSHE